MVGLIVAAVLILFALFVAAKTVRSSRRPERASSSASGGIAAR